MTPAGRFDRTNATTHPIECEHCGARYSWPTPPDDVPTTWDELREKRACTRCRGLFTLGPILPPDNRAMILHGTSGATVGIALAIFLTRDPGLILFFGLFFGALVGGVARWRPGRPRIP